MKKLFVPLLILIFLFAVGYVVVQLAAKQVKKDLTAPISANTTPSPTLAAITPKQKYESSSLFVPYWSMTGSTIDADEYDELLYFGITPTRTSIDTSEAGYKRLATFNRQAGNTEKHLVLRMIDREVNLDILDNANAQKSIIAETISVANQYKYDGIVINLEISGLPSERLQNQITEFIKKFSQEAKNEKLEVSMTLYGDTFYRIRPFAIEKLDPHVDRFYIMAYDFHKAGGNPGPNFPLHGKETYGYDYTLLIEGLLSKTKPEKITIIFGLFGYDWTVDDKGNSIEVGDPLSYNKIKQDFITTCAYKDCTIKRDSSSSETKITYTDDSNKKHVVWFEDMESVKKKKEYLKTRGINSFSFWAYSYF